MVYIILDYTAIPFPILSLLNFETRIIQLPILATFPNTIINPSTYILFTILLSIIYINSNWQPDQYLSFDMFFTNSWSFSLLTCFSFLLPKHVCITSLIVVFTGLAYIKLALTQNNPTRGTRIPNPHPSYYLPSNNISLFFRTCHIENNLLGHNFVY